MFFLVLFHIEHSPELFTGDQVLLSRAGRLSERIRRFIPSIYVSLVFHSVELRSLPVGDSRHAVVVYTLSQIILELIPESFTLGK